MSSKTPTTAIGVDNILSFNGHGGKISGKSFTLDPNSNVYILVPFGLDVELPPGQTKTKTDTTFKGLDVCYGFPSPENISGKTQSFEDIIYSKAGKLKLTFGLNVDAKWYLYKPGDDVPNVNYYPWKTGDPAAAAATCKEVSTKYDPFVSDLMKNCLASSDELNKKVCALFVSDSTKTTTAADGSTTSVVLQDNGGTGNYHLKLKICGSGDDSAPTATLEELANNCRKLVNFSKEVVKNSKASSASASPYASGYDDANILPKSGPTDPIILMPFTCNSCNATADIPLDNDTSNLKDVATLSEIIAGLAGGGDGGSSGSSGDPPSGKVAQFFMTFDDGSNSGLNSDKQAQKIVNFVNCLMGEKYKHIGLTYSANQDQTIEVFNDYKYDKSLSDNKFENDQEKNISSQILSGTNQANVLTKLNEIIKNNASYSDFKKAFRVIPFTTMRYVTNVKHDLDVSAPGNNTECIEAAKNFLKLENSIILGWCNQDSEKLPDKTGKKTFAIGGGEAAKLQDANNLYIPQYLQFLEKEWNEEVQKIVNICNPNHASVDAGASSTSPPSKVAPSKPLDDIIKDLIASIKDNEDTKAQISSLGIKEPPGGLVYKYTSSDASPPPSSSSASPPSSASTPPPPPVTEDKNLNSAEPAIEDMITAFENSAGGERDFYLVACRSIEAAYELEMKGITGDDSNTEVIKAKIRAKLLLNLRKNSLLLKVPARWDYVEMKMGVEPTLTPDEEKEMFIKLQEECEKLGQTGGAGYASEEAYKLAEQLIPLDTEIENEKLEKKNKVVLENYPDNKITYLPIKDVLPGFKVIIKQDSANCGRAALANFFGTEDFLTKGDPTKTEELFNLKIQRPVKIDMSSICHLNKKYSDIFVDVPNNTKDKEDYKYVTNCPDSENYSINVLSIVLQVLGYEDLTGITFDKINMTQYEDNKVKLNESYDNADVLGYLVNINKGHWICYKRENIGSNSNSFYRINSMDDNFNDTRTLEKLVEFDSITNNNNFIQLHPITKNNDSYNQKIFSKLTAIDEGNKNYYKDKITENETNNKWKLFKKDVTSELAKDSTLFVIDNQVRIMNYLSNLPSNKSDTNKQITIGLNDTNNPYGSIQSKIISLDTIQKKQVIDIFIQNIKNNLNKLDFITADNYNLRNIAYDKDNNLYEPDFDAKNRYYYSLTQTCNYKKGDTFNPDLAKSGYFESANTLLEEIDTLFKTSEFTRSSSSGGGFKPRHNPITNHATSKSRHNSSFKVSSSKTKGKSHNRSHTQRVK